MKSEDIPKDILKVIEAEDGILDEFVHDIKSNEASDINNNGYWSQLDYLVGEGITWDWIREYLCLDPEE